VCNARIQGVYDLISGSFVSFSIDPYRKNDLKAAPMIDIQEGDLVLRDRGYYLNNEIKRHLDVGADCIYRYKHKTSLFHILTGDSINLLKELEQKQKLNMNVKLNNQDKTEVRLVAYPVSEEIANTRRMKAKKNCRRYNLSKEFLKLMSWNIFITTIPNTKADHHKLRAIYRLRWRIEIIFKIWKSNMDFAKVHNVSEKQLQVLLLSRFIMIVICTNIIYSHYFYKVKEKSGRYLSMMKLIHYLVINQEIFIKCLMLIKSKTAECDTMVIPLIKYCTYDKRKRLNHSQLFEKAFLS
jgi:hypothetical protein